MEDLIGEIVSALDAGTIKVGDLPENIRIRQILPKYESWNIQIESKRWAFLKHCVKSPFLDDDAPHVPGSIDADVFVQGFANPGTSAIKHLFESVGLADIWSEFKALEPQNAYKSEIDAIVYRRNDIAHGDHTATVNASDIGQYLANFKHTALVFDTISLNYIRRHLPAFAW